MRTLFLAVIAVLALSGCAESIAPPVVVQDLAAQPQGIRITGVTAEARPGVIMTRFDLERIGQLVKAYISSQSPNSLIRADGSATRVNLVFTQYDKGNAFARAMLAGLGQIRIDADVMFVDEATGRILGQYQVSKDFAFGGIYGASTRIEDVEQGFAKSVAEIVRTKA